MQLTGMEEEGIEIMAENIKKKPLFGRYVLRQKTTNTIYSRKVELSIWSGLILLRKFVSDGLFSIRFAEDVGKLFHSL
jgi:hypothetical protein